MSRWHCSYIGPASIRERVALPPWSPTRCWSFVPTAWDSNRKRNDARRTLGKIDDDQTSSLTAPTPCHHDWDHFGGSGTSQEFRSVSSISESPDDFRYGSHPILDLDKALGSGVRLSVGLDHLEFALGTLDAVAVFHADDSLETS